MPNPDIPVLINSFQSSSLKNCLLQVYCWTCSSVLKVEGTSGCLQTTRHYSSENCTVQIRSFYEIELKMWELNVSKVVMVIHSLLVRYIPQEKYEVKSFIPIADAKDVF
jgi:hypothetical protein